MKHPIHPDYETCTVSCSCGNSFDTRSTATKGALKVEICGQCHPFYTGRQKFVDTAGRIQRFQEKYKWKGDRVTAAAKKEKKAAVAPAPQQQDDAF